MHWKINTSLVIVGFEELDFGRSTDFIYWEQILDAKLERANREILVDLRRNVNDEVIEVSLIENKRKYL